MGPVLTANQRRGSSFSLTCQGPGALSQHNLTGALTQSDLPGALSQHNLPGALSQSDLPGALRQHNLPGP